MWKLQALLYSFLIPKEFTLVLGTLNLSTYRVLLLMLAPWVFWQLIVHRKFNWQSLDSLALLVCIWPFIALNFNTDVVTAVESGGVLFLETFVPFFAARLLIYKYEHLVSLSKTLLLVASLMALFALPEAITGTPYIHELASLVSGNSFTHSPESRLGIWRSYGPTDHPIILGSICASAIPIGFAISRRRNLYKSMTALSVSGVIASASSGPLLSVVAQISLYTWSRLTRGKHYKWWLLVFLILATYATIDVLSNRDPLRVMFSYLLFNEHNGYVRYNMWLNSFYLAGQSAHSFFVGYGFSTEMMSLLDNMFWSQLMSASVDSYWMVLLLRYGAPMLALSALWIILIFRANIRNYRRHRLNRERALIQAWLITAISLSLVACTVHFWGSTASLFFIVMGATAMGKRRSLPRRRRTSSTTKPEAERPAYERAKF